MTKRSIALPRPMLRQIEKAADAEGLTTGEYIRAALRGALGNPTGTPRAPHGNPEDGNGGGEPGTPGEPDRHPQGTPGEPRGGDCRGGGSGEGGGVPDPSVDPPTSTGGDEAAGADPPPIPDDPVVMEFPVVGQPQPWRLTAGKLGEYQEAFPGVEVGLALRSARQWCLDNPTRRKTPRGMPKFLHGWLERRQNGQHGSGTRPAPAASRRPAPNARDAEMLHSLVTRSGGDRG